LPLPAIVRGSPGQRTRSPEQPSKQAKKVSPSLYCTLQGVTVPIA
jgi:hypothetical protein